jgi:hypothetical protein
MRFYHWQNYRISLKANIKWDEPDARALIEDIIESEYLPPITSVKFIDDKRCFSLYGINEEGSFMVLPPVVDGYIILHELTHHKLLMHKTYTEKDHFNNWHHRAFFKKEFKQMLKKYNYVWRENNFKIWNWFFAMKQTCGIPSRINYENQTH